MQGRVRLVPRTKGLLVSLGVFLAGCGAELAESPSSIPGPLWGAQQGDRAPPPQRDEVPVLMVPVDGVGPERVPDTFAAARSGGRVHQASDILAPRGTPVVSADDGTIQRIGINRLGGNMIYATDLSERFVYYYAHLDRFASGLFKGQHVRRGEILGYVGTTGNAPAHVPHLHFQLMRRPANGSIYGGTPIDAQPYLLLPGRALPGRPGDPQRGEPQRVADVSLVVTKT